MTAIRTPIRSGSADTAPAAYDLPAIPPAPTPAAPAGIIARAAAAAAIAVVAMVAAVALLVLPRPVSAARYEVGPDRVHKRLQDVTGRLNPGDSVLVDGDATYAGGVVFRRPGAPGRPIVVLGVPRNGRRPVLTGGDTALNTVHFRSDDPASGADHYVFQGFEVTGGASRCVYHQAGDLVLRDLVVRDCPRQGILGGDQGSGSLTLEDSEVYRCGGGDRDHQIYMATDEVNRPGSVFRMRRCYVHDARGGNNVKSRAERNEIHYNWIEGAYYHELELIGPDPGGAPAGWGPRLKREDSDVAGNVFWKRRTAAGNDSDFAVFRVGGDGAGESHGRYRFTHNTVIAGSGAVFRCFDSLESVEMHNNVFHRPGGGLNLMRTAEAEWTRGRAAVAGSGNWVTDGAQNVPAGWTGTLTGADPGFVSFASRDLRPSPASPLVDAGVSPVQGPDGLPFPDPLFPPAFLPSPRAGSRGPVARPVKGALDVGAYEEGSPAALRRPGGGARPSRRSRPGGLAVRGPAASPAAAWGPPGETPELRTLDGRDAD
jgi:hypothetical protein